MSDNKTLTIEARVYSEFTPTTEYLLLKLESRVKISPNDYEVIWTDGKTSKNLIGTVIKSNKNFLLSPYETVIVYEIPKSGKIVIGYDNDKVLSYSLSSINKDEYTKLIKTITEKKKGLFDNIQDTVKLIITLAIVLIILVLVIYFFVLGKRINILTRRI